MKYRKKPIVIEAFKYDGDFTGANTDCYVPLWAIEAHQKGVLFFSTFRDKPYELFVKTLEGDMHVCVGDYVIKGVHGEIYPCKPDIFEATYETI